MSKILSIPKNKLFIYGLLGCVFCIFLVSTLFTYEKYRDDFLKNEENAQIKMTKIIHQSMSSYFETLKILVENAVLSPAYTPDHFNVDDHIRFQTVPNAKSEIEKYQITKILNSPKSVFTSAYNHSLLEYWQIFKGLPETLPNGKTLALERRRIARNILKTFKDIHYVFEMDPNGDLVFLEPFEIQKNISSFNYAFRDYLRIVKNTRSTGVSEGYISHDQNRTQIITVATPVFDSSSRVAKVLAISVSAATLRDRVFRALKEHMDVKDGTVFYLVDRHGHIVASSNGKHIYFPKDGAKEDEADVGNIRGTGLFKSFVWRPDTLEQGNIYERETKSWDIGSLKSYVSSEYINLDGKEVVATFMPTSILGTETVNWGILVETPKHQVLASQSVLKVWFYFLTLLLVIVLVGFSYLIFNQFGKLEKTVLSKEGEIKELSKRVAHDIRSPLAALNLVVSDLSELPEKKRVLLRSAVSRIKDIANDLTGTETSKPAAVPATPAAVTLQQDGFMPLLLLDLVEEVVTETKIQTKLAAHVQIRSSISVDSAGVFIRGINSELKRALSNIINNAIESIRKEGLVCISTFLHGESVVVEIADNGSGIDACILPKLMQKGATFNKPSGSGLGLYYSKQTVHNHGGTIKMESVIGTGTRVIIELPRVASPVWHPKDINLRFVKNIVILDDDESIHHIWSDRIKLAKGQNIVHFMAAKQLEEWIAYHKDESNLFLVDYELIEQNTNGVEVIDKLKINSSSILVTSRYNESVLIDECVRKGIKLLPKSIAGFIKIVPRTPVGDLDRVAVNEV